MPPVEIQWCDHSSVLLEYLRQLYDEGRFVDVGLECEGQQVKAHKAVISACSPYLEGLLKGNPARSHLIKFNGYSYNSLRAVIDFMYNGKVLVEQDQLAAFLKLGRALQVRGILDIAAQCEEAGLTTPEETKSNAQYSTTVQQTQKLAQQQQQQQQQQVGRVQQQQQQTTAEAKKYGFMLDKTSGNAAKKPVGQYRKVVPNIIEQQPSVSKVSGIGTTQATHVQHQTQPVQQIVQQTQQQQVVQQQQQQQSSEVGEEHTQQGQQQQVHQEGTPTTLEELQRALASGQAILQTDPNGGEQTLQMVEGQCMVTGSGQTYVVVQEGDNISFVPAEMVQGDLQAAVNGGQVVEGLDPVEQQLAQMEGQAVDGSQADGSTQRQEGTTTTAGTSADTMSVVESLVKLGQKQPGEGENGGVTTEEQTEVGADMPDLEGDVDDATGTEGGELEEGDDTTVGDGSKKRSRQPSQKMMEAMGMAKRKATDSSQGGRGKKLKN